MRKHAKEALRFSFGVFCRPFAVKAAAVASHKNPISSFATSQARVTNRVEENTLSKLLKARNNGRGLPSRLWGKAFAKSPNYWAKHGVFHALFQTRIFCLPSLGYAQELYIHNVNTFSKQQQTRQVSVLSRALGTGGPWSIRNSKQDRRRSTTFVAFPINIANDENIIHVVHMNERAIVEDIFSVN